MHHEITNEIVSDAVAPKMRANMAGHAGLKPEVRADICARLHFSEIWSCDFEFVSPDGENPDPVCMVAREILSGREIWLWRDELRQLNTAPWNTGPETATLALAIAPSAGAPSPLS